MLLKINPEYHTNFKYNIIPIFGENYISSHIDPDTMYAFMRKRERGGSLEGL